MPAKPLWLIRLPTIRHEIASLPAPVFDRALVERVFQVGRRRAIQLLDHFGGYQAGRTFLIPKAQLLTAVDGILNGGDYRCEKRRRERLSAGLEELRRRHAAAGVRLPVAPDVWGRDVAGLGPGVHLEPGRLVVEFTTAYELLARLFELAQAVSNDYERFRDRVETKKDTGSYRDTVTV
jgi:hypothetical protein